MADGNWRCGMCAAYNEPSKQACMVCETVRALGARGDTAEEGDLLAPGLGMFADHGESVRHPPPDEGELPPMRVMEPPPPRPGTAVPDRDRAGRVPGPDSWHRPRSDSGTRAEAGPLPRTAADRRTDPEPRSHEPEAEVDTGPPSETGPPLSRARPGSRWSPPRWPQGTVRALALAVVGGVVLVLVWVLPGVDEGAGPAESPGEGGTCPERIASLVPGGGNGPLVESYQTERHRIVLCANSSGELYYFGEFLDGSGEAMVVPAVATEDGYVADAGETRYEIGGGEVVITGGDGAEMARLPLETVPAPE